MARMIWSSALFLSLLQICVANPLNFKRWDDLETKHAWVETPRNWELVGPARADHRMQMQIGLKQDRMHELIDHLYQVSDPAHDRYGNHLSKEEVDALVAPHSDSVDLVDSWLAHHGVDTSSRTGAGDWVTMTVTVEQAEKMLGTKYNVYKHIVTSETIVRTMSYSLPRVMHEHVSVVTPATYFGTIKAMRATSFVQSDDPMTTDATCGSKVTPACLRDLYNSASYVPSATATNSLGIAGYLDEYANRADLQTFLKAYRSDAVGANFTLVQVNGGGDDQSNPGVEANLDIQYTEGISYPTPNVYYSTGGSPPYTPDYNEPTNTNEPYLDWLNYVLAQDSIPQTFSTSYGDDEQSVPLDYATSVCNAFAQLGARGSSVLFSSGDSGVGSGACTSNDGSGKTMFIPNFPASCPYVTSVGGTTGTSPEKTVDFSSGGFSNYFGIPDYQASAVSTFLGQLGDTYSGLYNASGRGIPDVAAQGSGFQVVIGGSTESVGGTSASCPTFSAIVALLNDYRIANGKSSLGFLNPLLYSTGTAGLNDITSGTNPGCSTDGFTAVAGWDPATGLGTPDFGKLQAIVLAAA